MIVNSWPLALDFLLFLYRICFHIWVEFKAFRWIFKHKHKSKSKHLSKQTKWRKQKKWCFCTIIVILWVWRRTIRWLLGKNGLGLRKIQRLSVDWGRIGSHSDKPFKAIELGQCVLVCMHAAGIPPSYPAAWPAAAVWVYPYKAFYTHTHTEKMLHSSHIKQTAAEEKNLRARRRSKSKHTTLCSRHEAYLAVCNNDPLMKKWGLFHKKW